MKVTLERLPESRVQLEIEVEPDRLEQSLDAAYRRLVRRMKVPGFRPGKAPRRVIERMVGREGLIHEALDSLVPDVYSEALTSEDVDAIDQPELEILELDPVRFKATVAVRPNVELGDYSTVSLESETVEVTDEMVAEQMEHIRRRFATLAPVERGAEWNDVLTADIVANVEDEPFVEDKDAEFQLREGQRLLLPDLAEQFVDMKAGDEKQADLTIPDDFQAERLRGKTANFTLSVKAVKEENLPDEDDDLAQQVNADEFETIDQLRERIRADLLESLQRQANEALRLKAVDELVEISEIDFPAVLLEREIDELIRESHGSDVRAYQMHLAQIGQTAEQFREGFREVADRRLRRSLVVSTLAEAEGLEISEDEIEAERQRLLEPLGEQAEQFRQMFESDEGVATIRRNLLTDKTLERLQSAVTREPEEASE